MKVFMFFINAIFWLWCFIVPSGILGFLGLWLYLKNSHNLPFSIILGIIGIIGGFYLAELIRKKYGLDNFFGRILATPDIDGGNILDEKNTEEVKKSEED